MPVLFAANELEGFQVIGSSAVFNRTVSGEYDPNYCRVGMAVTTVAQLVHDFVAGASTDFWVHFEVSFLNRPTSTAAQFMRLVDSATGQVLLQLDFDSGTPPVARLEYWDGAAFSNVSGSNSFSQYSTSADRYRIDVHCKIHDTAGRFAWYVNESLQGELTGDTLFTGFTGVDRLELTNPTGSSTTSATATVFSQVIIATQPTLDWKLGTMFPDGAGNYTAWTGAFGDVDENGLDDTDFVAGSNSGDKEYFTVSTPPSTTAKEIIAVVVSGRCLRLGARSMSLDVRSGSSDGLGDFFTPDAGQVPYPYQHMHYLNPATGAGWVGADLAALQVGVNIRA